MLLMSEEAAVWTEKDDKEIEYGKWNIFAAETTLAEEHKVNPSKKMDDIWPHWSEGKPTKLRLRMATPSFILGTVRHNYREYIYSLELEWNNMYMLSVLKNNYYLLPSAHKSEWSGVYRIFSPNMIIDRFGGKDPTGTLYLGRAGSGNKNWSILRTRIMSIANKEHHAINNWLFNNLIRQKYPWESLAVEWAYTGEKLNETGEPIAEAKMAERWLLNCYKNSYGEFPPWNQKG
jgi:hypothetical protein